MHEFAESRDLCEGGWQRGVPAVGPPTDEPRENDGSSIRIQTNQRAATVPDADVLLPFWMAGAQHSLRFEPVAQKGLAVRVRKNGQVRHLQTCRQPQSTSCIQNGIWLF